MIFAEKMKALRNQKRLSTGALAEKLGISETEVVAWEQEGSIPDLDNLQMISQFFGVDIDFLLEDEQAEVLRENSYKGKKQEKEMMLSYHDADSFLDSHEGYAKRNALALVFGLLMFLCLTFSARFSLDMTGIRNILLLLLLVAAVITKIAAVKKLSDYKQIKKKTISLYQGVEEMVLQREENYKQADKYKRLQGLGYLLSVGSLLPLLVATFFHVSNAGDTIAIMLFLISISTGAYLLFWVQALPEGCQMLLQQGLYTPKRKKISRWSRVVSNIFWILVILYYVLCTLYTQQAEITWIILCAAWLLHAIVHIILTLLANRKGI